MTEIAAHHEAPAESSWMAMYPREAWQKAAFRFPILLWRMGLGPLLGRIFMLITHTGRTSGLPRRTVVEYHRLEDGRKVIPCAFGERAQWYRNIAADPRVTIQTADGVERVSARRLRGDDELLAAYNVLMRRNALMMRPYLESLGINPADPIELLEKRDRVYLLTFDPTDEPTPPPVEADLTGAWAVIGAALALILLPGLLRRRR
ncbi:MAG: hypothetical protein Kow00124_30190 [Anaerolineae bacterium]